MEERQTNCHLRFIVSFTIQRSETRDAKFYIVCSDFNILFNENFES